MDELRAFWAQHEPTVRAYAEHAVSETERAMDRAQVLFQRDDVLVPKAWKASGDWYKDMFTAWDAAFSGTLVKANTTHYAIRNAGADVHFQQTWQMKAELKDLYPVPEENLFDGTPFSAYMREYYQIPIIISAVYLVGIFAGKLLMSPMPALRLKFFLFLWNLALSAFSIVGAARTVPHLLLTIERHGLYASICSPVGQTFGGGAAGLWSFLFIVSKIPELVDTVFIVLRKKPLIFLHWYHHFTVLLYVWQSYATQSSAGIYFIAMNYTVHAVMYLYYALSVYNLWPRFVPSFLITLLQLTQMVLGIWICYKIFEYKTLEKMPCSTSDVSFQSGVVMYFTYFLLFLQILFKVLTRKPRAAAPSRTKKTN